MAQTHTPHNPDLTRRPARRRFRPLVNAAVLRQRLGARLFPTTPGALRARGLRP